MPSVKQETTRSDPRVEFHRVDKVNPAEVAKEVERVEPTVDVEDLVADVRAHLDDRMNGIEAGLERLAFLADAITRAQSPFGEAPPLAPPAPVSRPATTRSVAVDTPVAKSAAPAIEPKPAPAAPAAAAPASGPQALVTRVANSPRANAILLSWAETLAKDLGHEGVPEGLAHLEAIGWIGPDVRARLARIADGIDVPEPRAQVAWRLSPAALRSSLEHIDHLRGTRGD